MKKFLLTFALLLALCVPWAHGQTLNEGFESTTFPPDDWTSIHVSGADKSWARYTSDHNTGSACAYMNWGSSGTWTYNWLITPKLAPKTGESLSFYVKNSSSGTTNVYVKVSTTDTDPASFSDLQDITSDITGTWSQISIDLSAYAGQNIFIGFYVEDYFGKNIFIDDVSGVSLYLPACSPLQSLYISDITRTSITANWTKKTVATNCVGYEVKISTSSNPDDAAISTVTIDNPATTSYTFENLERNTTYYVHACPNCGVEDGYGEWVTASATTKALSGCFNATVADGTNTSEYIPVYGGYCDELQKTQSIYPASMLTELAGKTISKLKYYVTSGGSSSWSSAVFSIKMKVVDVTTLSGLLPTTDATVVYTGTLSASVAGGMEINLTTPFTYTGGNLLIMFDETSASNYGGCTFRGTEVSSASYLDNVGWGVGTYSFLPKVDFGYCETVEACPAVTNVAVSDIAQTTANLSWTASTGDYANTYDVLVSDTIVTDFTNVEPQYTNLDTCGQALTGLEQYTNYYVYVRVNCNAYGHDEDGATWSDSVYFKTLSKCIIPTDLTVTPLTKTSAKAQWIATSQTSNYRYILSTEELEYPDNEAVTASGINKSNVLLNRLTPGETYYLYLSNACGGDDGNSPYISTTFTMPEACIAPTDINITDVQKYQMTLNWTPSQFAEDGDAYDIYVSTTEVNDFTDIVPTYTGVTGTSKVIDLLQRNITYYIYMRSNCGEESVTDWSEAVSETTLDNVPDCDDIVVADGTTTHSNTPLDFYNTDGGGLHKAQFLYPASLLAENGVSGTIKGVTFYDRSGSSKTLSAVWTVKMGTTTSTNLSAGFCSDALTTVYSGNYVISAGVVSFVFDNNFDYAGGNLVVEISCTGASGNWYGGTGTTGYYGVDGIGSTYSTKSSYTNFLPKTTFSQCNVALLCPAVAAPVASDVTNTEATITWNAGTGDFATSYDLVVSATPVNDFETAELAADGFEDTTFTVTGLTANTHYYAYVRVNCVNDIYNDGSSVWSPAGEFTTELPCLKPENFVATSPLSDRVELSWIKKGTAVDWKIAIDTVDLSLPGFVHADTVDVNIAACTVVEDTVTYLLTGLEPDKQYLLHLFADCGEVDGLSKDAVNTPYFATLSNKTGIYSMGITSAEVFDYALDSDAKTINFVVRKGSDLEAMDGYITLYHWGAQVRLNGEPFVAPWDISAPVTVTVLAQDTTVTADWTITVTEEACATPFNVAATDIERRTANLVWNIGDASTQFDVIVSETELSETELADTTVQSVTVTNTEGACTYAVTGLTRGTHYHIYVRTNCGESFGKWRGTDFTTKSLVDCSIEGTIVTIADGTNTSSYFPFYGYWQDTQGTESQFIYGSDMLTELRGKSISKMTFYSTTSSQSFTGTNRVSIGITSDNSFSGAFKDSPSQVVFTGQVSVSGYQHTIVFDAPFEYPAEGGNLLIEYLLTAAGNCPGVSFYGINTSSYTGRCRSSNYQFLPKVNFTCCGESNACPEVTNVAIDNIAETSATVTWTESTGDYANESDIYYSTNPDTTGVIAPMVTNVTGNSAEITGLANYTTYYVWVRTHCDGEKHDDGISPWAGGTSFRTLSPCRVPGTPEATITGKHTATVTWTNTSEGSQADNFTYIYSATPIAEADLETAEATASAYNDTTVDLTGLLSDTTYYFYVRNVCTGDVNCGSPWDSCQFTMPASMPAVINLQAYDIASNAFSAVWESDLANFADETAWEVACVATGETPDTWTEVSAPERFVIGLTPSTTYDFYVRAKDGESHSANAKTTVTTTAVPADCITLFDGTVTSRNIPFYVYYADDYTKANTIMPANSLQQLAGKDITSMTFYIASTGSCSSLFEVYLKEVENATVSSTPIDVNTATKVYGPATINFTGATVEITFPEPFHYNGGNLMIATQNTTDAGYKEIYFYGMNSGSSGWASNSYLLSSITSFGSNTSTFVPKTTFCTAPEACRSVANLVVDNITATSARAHWYPGAAETKWFVYNSTEPMTTNDLANLDTADCITVDNVPQIALTDLTKDMDYYLYVSGSCGDNVLSKWMEIHYMTLPSCSAPATAVATSDADNSITFTASAGEYGTEGTYDYRYWIVGSDDTTTVAGQGAEYTATGLATDADYAWEVRANCSGDDEGSSRWIAGNNVHVCGSAIYVTETNPFVNNFDGTPFISECWRNEHFAGSGSSVWTRYTSWFHGSTGASAYLPGVGDNIVHLVLPELNIPAENEYEFKFWMYHTSCVSTYPKEGVRVLVNTINDTTGAVEILYIRRCIGFDNAGWHQYSAPIPMSGNVYVIIQGIEEGYDTYIDDVQVSKRPVYTISSAVAPEVTPAIGSVEVAYNEGDTLSAGVFFGGTAPVFTAVHNEGIEFINWTNANNGDTLSIANPWTVTIAQDTAIVANFDTASFNLNVLVAPGHDIFGEVAGSGTFRYGRTVNFSATPMDHYSVVWPDSSTDNNRTIVMPAHDTTIVARFAIDKHTLTVAMNDSSKGTVTGTGVYDYGTFVDITAAPIDPVHMIFTGWSNGETNPNITIDLQHDSTVVANFIWDDHTVTTDVNDPSMGSVTGAGTYTHDDVARLIATPTDHHIFVEWSNGLTNDTIDITVVSDTALTATFDWDSHDIIANVNVDAMGTVEGAGHYYHGTPVTLTAIPAAHHHFVNWSNGVTDNPYNIIADEDTTLTANFAIDQHTVTLLENIAGRGTQTGAGTYDYGTPVQISTTPTSSHYVFDGWDNGETDATVIINLVSDTTITANYIWDQHTITGLVNIDSMGTVEGSATVEHGTEVTLTAVPAAHHHFVNWSNGVTTPTWTVVADTDSIVTANFAIDQHTITAVPVDTLRGKVTGGGIFNYGDTATLIAEGKYPYQFSRWDDENLSETDTLKVKVLGDATYTAYFKFNEFDVIVRSADQTMGNVTGGGAFVYDTIVNVTAIPNEHYHFAHWNNGSVDPTTTVIVKFDTVLTAYFAIDQHIVTTNVNNNALGSVSGAGTYDYGTQVKLIAIPADDHSVFTGWSNGETNDTIIIDLAGDTTVTAIFSYDTHVIAATANDAAMGSITGAGTYTHGTLASLTAVANAHYHFVNWSNGLTTNTFSILVDKDSAVVANFAIDEHIVTTNVNNNALGTVAGAGTYNYGASVTLTATPASHGVFTGWSDGTTVNPYTFALTGDTTVTANFSYDTHVIAATANDAAMGSITGTGTYTHGTLASLTAVANAHYHFVNWSNGLTTNTFSILVDKDSAVVANFAIDEHIVTTNVNNNALGSVSGAGTYNYGASVTLTATPAAHGVFTGWSDGTTVNPYTFALTGDTTVTANFSYDTHVIAATANDAAMGSITGTGTYTHGTLASLTAVANAHYHFVNWSNGLTTNTFSILVDKDSAVVANFAIDQHVVTATSGNAVLGSVTGAGTYNYGASVTLTAIPTAHGVFIGWSDGTTVNPYTFNLTGDVNVTANFSYDTHTIAANVNSTTMGSVAGAGTYPHGTLASLTAVANAHYHFVNWSNGLTANTFSILVDKDSAVVANFAIDQHVVTATSGNAVLGSVTGAGTYNYGASVTLTAIPTAHGVFTGWSDGTTVNPYTFNLTGDVNVTANFSYDTHTIAANVNSTTMGSVAGAGTYTHGTLATLVATPNAHYHFTGWDNGLTANTFSILVDKDSTVTANFAIDQHNVSAIVNDENMGSVTGTGAYNYGSTAALTAVPAANHHFVGWNTGNTNVTQTVNVTGDITFIATFAINQHTVTVISNDVNLGMVTGTGYYDYGDQVVITAVPNDNHYVFMGWSNGLTTPSAIINVTKDTVITATFVRNVYNITLNVNDATMGSVTGAGAYTYGDVVTIEATPVDDCHSFVRWSDGMTTEKRTFSVTGDLALTAFFAMDNYTISVASSNNAGGVAYCDKNGSHVSSMKVTCGTLVEIHAEPEQYYRFVEWSDGVTDAIRQVEAAGDSDLVAIFEPNCGDLADFPVIFMYNGLIMLDLDSVRSRGYNPKPNQVTWYQVVGDVDNIEASFPADDKLICSGYYLSLPTNNLGYGQYYAVIDVSNTREAICHDKMKSVVVEYTSEGKNINVQMAPTHVKSGDVMTITGLMPDERTTIMVYDYTGKTIDVMQTEGLDTYDITAHGATGVYMVKVTSDSVNETLKFIVTK